MQKTATAIIEVLEAWVGGLAFVAMFVAILLQVFFRYVLSSPLVWPLELSVYGYIYVIYVGTVMAARHKRHVTFDLIHGLLPVRMRRVLDVATNLFLAVLLAMVIPASVMYIRVVGGLPSPSLGIPMAVVLVVFPVALALVVLTFMLRAYRDLRALMAGEVH